MELHKKCRPRKLKHLKGQDEVVRVITQYFEKGGFPQASILSGPSGCGKTTIAMILKNMLNCGDTSFKKINSASFRGIDTIREIHSKLTYHALDGDCRIWLIDEAHKLTNDAQNAFLEMLEFTPPNVYFILCTTEPDKLIKAVQTRCAPLHVNLLSPKSMSVLLNEVALKEDIELTEEVCDKIVESAEGSARMGLVLLEKIIGIEDEEHQLSALFFSSSAREQMIELFKMLMNTRSNWKDFAKVLRAVKEEPETIRHYVMACCRNIMLAGGPGSSRANLVAQAFRDAWYDCKEIGLACACYEVVGGK